ncbi:unnamed protein product, partial [Polarella glacialis]
QPPAVLLEVRGLLPPNKQKPLSAVEPSVSPDLPPRPHSRQETPSVRMLEMPPRPNSVQGLTPRSNHHGRHVAAAWDVQGLTPRRENVHSIQGLTPRPQSRADDAQNPSSRPAMEGGGDTPRAMHTPRQLREEVYTPRASTEVELVAAAVLRSPTPQRFGTAAGQGGYTPDPAVPLAATQAVASGGARLGFAGMPLDDEMPRVDERSIRE